MLIEGGDNEFYPPMSNYLEASNIPLKKLSDCDENFLKKFDLIIVGNVVPGTSNEAKDLNHLGLI